MPQEMTHRTTLGRDLMSKRNPDATPPEPNNLKDIAPLLKGWDYEAGAINVRKITGLDGKEKESRKGGGEEKDGEEGGAKKGGAQEGSAQEGRAAQGAGEKGSGSGSAAGGGGALDAVLALHGLGRWR